MSAADSRGAGACGCAAGRAARTRPGRLVHGPEHLRPLHFARRARHDAADHLRRVLRHHPGARATSSIRYEMIHEARVIPLDRRPRLSPAIRQYMGDSRGWWEGDTLVVETTNVHDNMNYRGATSGLKVTERFTPVGPDRIDWEARMEDPDHVGASVGDPHAAETRRHPGHLRVRVPRGQPRTREHPEGRPRRGRPGRTGKLPRSARPGLLRAGALGLMAPKAQRGSSWEAPSRVANLVATGAWPGSSCSAPSIAVLAWRTASRSACRRKYRRWAIQTHQARQGPVIAPARRLQRAGRRGRRRGQRNISSTSPRRWRSAMRRGRNWMAKDPEVKAPSPGRATGDLHALPVSDRPARRAELHPAVVRVPRP